MRSLKIAHVIQFGAALVAMAAAIPALAAPPVLNDDARVGAPPVILPRGAAPVAVAAPPAPPVAKVRVVQPQPVQARAVQVLPKAMPPMPPRSVTAVPPAVIAPIPAVAAERPRERPMPPGAQSSVPMREAYRGPGAGGAVYHRPEYGFRVPAEWTAAEYYIPDFDNYGLSRPARGFGWSRYYDDAVLTDQWGRIYDWRDDVNWAENGGGRDGYDRDERFRGDDRRDYERPRDKKSRGRKYDYKGRWTGSWDNGPVQTYQGEWRGSVRPHWSGGGDRGREDNRGVSYGGGSYGSSYGYDGGGTTVTTVVIQAAAPVMTTREISYDVVSYVPIRKKIVRAWKPRPKPVCVCGS